MKIYRISKNCSIDYYTLDPFLDPSNLLYLARTILHYLTALKESKSFQKCRSYYHKYLFDRYFVRELIGFSRLAYIVYIVDFFMLYRIRRNFCIEEEDILHNMTALSESKSVQKCRNF